MSRVSHQIACVMVDAAAPLVKPAGRRSIYSQQRRQLLMDFSFMSRAFIASYFLKAVSSILNQQNGWKGCSLFQLGLQRALPAREYDGHTTVIPFTSTALYMYTRGAPAHSGVSGHGLNRTKPTTKRPRLIRAEPARRSSPIESSVARCICCPMPGSLATLSEPLGHSALDILKGSVIARSGIWYQ